jgi:hypothetical protein
MKECHILNQLTGNCILFSLLFLYNYHDYKKYWEELITLISYDTTRTAEETKRNLGDTKKAK